MRSAKCKAQPSRREQPPSNPAPSTTDLLVGPSLRRAGRRRCQRLSLSGPRVQRAVPLGTSRLCPRRSTPPQSLSPHVRRRQRPSRAGLRVQGRKVPVPTWTRSSASTPTASSEKNKACTSKRKGTDASPSSRTRSMGSRRRRCSTTLRGRSHSGRVPFRGVHVQRATLVRPVVPLAIKSAGTWKAGLLR
jgi:hypothetical protein